MHQVKAMVNEVAGKFFKNKELEIDGKIEKSRGKVQEQVGCFAQKMVKYDHR